ncbi:MAG: alpha/beta fold hydrolase [Terracidiphilus sp.]|jgi:dipeptidyl aminopeptidase/acylaminoacyl peptidase
MKLARSFLHWALALVAAWILFCSAVGIVATEWALHPGRRLLGPKLEAQAEAIAERNHARLIEVSIVASDGVTLRAWSIPPLHGNGDVVILLHGQTDNRAGMLGNAELLLDHGYSVLLPDARAHGTSGGDLATYGVKEAGDLRLWFDWLQRSMPPRCIYGLGESMGAAQLLQSLRTTPGFCAVAAESSFASFREASYDRLGEKLHSGAWAGSTLLRPAVEAGFLYARWKYGVDFEQASPENAVAASRVPVLLIHGLKDTNLPPRHSEEIQAHNSSRFPAVQLWEPKEAGHCGAAGAEPEEFAHRVIGWFESHGTIGAGAFSPLM